MPFISTPTPVPNSEISAGIVEIGAILSNSNYNIPQKFNLQQFNQSQIEFVESTLSAGALPQKFNLQPFNRGISIIGQEREAKNRLQITVADNENYTNASEYFTDFKFDNNFAGAEHPFVEIGMYYLRMIAENENGDQSQPLQYIIYIVIIKYFISEPEINRKGPKANSVTVRSPSAEYTAFVDPAPSNEELIERMVEIDEGDATTCQIIAEALVDRWSGEQKNVTGNINLTVTLKFKEKIRVINNSIGLDEEMILQKKEHDVTGGITTITCGDIILSDDELLARILDDLKG